MSHKHNDPASNLLEDILEVLHRIETLLDKLLHQNDNRVLGGVMTQIGATMGTGSLLPIAPGNDVKFSVTPTWSENTPGVTAAAQAAVTSSDPANFPAVLDPADSTGLTIDVDIPAGATLEDGVVLTWTYTNEPDETTATVTGTYNISTGTFNDVIGGSFTQIQ